MSIDITGIDDLFRKFDRLIAFDYIEPPMERGGYRLEAYMKQYPPAPPDSRYIRGYGFPGHPTSEHLGQRWTVKKDRDTDHIRITVGNNASYGPWVQSDRFQTRMHRRTGWRTDQQAIRENEAAIIADVQQAVNAALEGHS